MKKAAPLIIIALCVFVVAFSAMNKKGEKVESVAWYGMMAHPYISEVEGGVKAYSKDSGTPVFRKTGREWTQDDENNNIEAMSTKGYKGYSIFPGDAAGANGLFSALKKKGMYVVAYGGEPALPTPASFTVATDIKGAAMLATEELIKLMGDKGNILNVLETVTDVNTIKRDEGIKEVVAKHPNVKIIQTIADMTQVNDAINKIQSALAARGGEINGIVTTGYNPTVAAAAVLTEWHKDKKNQRIRFVGIDTGPTVIKAIREGYIDETIAQNPFGHGYISCSILKMMCDGWTPKKDYQFVNAGAVVVSKKNIDTYPKEVRKITDSVLADLKTKYLNPPAK